MKRLIVPLIFIHSVAMSQPAHLSKIATNFIQSLSVDQKKRATYSFDHSERFNWHFFPKSDRKGIPIRDLSPEQQKLAHALLQASMSASGYKKTLGIIELEGVLQSLEGRGPDDDYRHPGLYYFAIFGTPSDKEMWAWRLEGHHLSLNFCSVDNKIVAGTPAFMGANPAVVPTGPNKGMQVLRHETELAFQLLQTLSKDQLVKCLISTRAPGDIITFVSRRAVIDDQRGLSYSEMTDVQRSLFMQLLEVYIHRYTKLFAEEMMERIRKADLNKLRFVWAGGQQEGHRTPYYYRIQGPTLIIEFDNSQNNANHIHSVVRDLTNDFGDLLADHYRQHHHPAPTPKKQKANTK